MEKQLREAWTRYRDHEKAGDDMAEAGQELARVVGRIVGPLPPCAPPRNMVLERLRRPGAGGTAQYRAMMGDDSTTGDDPVVEPLDDY